MREKMRRFMQGRYGVDALSRFLLGAGLLSIVLSSAFSGKYVGMVFYILGWFFFIRCYFRMFSKNITKRYAENQAYLAKTYGIRCAIQKQKNLMRQRKVYHIYKCPTCKQKIRIPRGKGRIEVRCPKCGTTFIKKS